MRTNVETSLEMASTMQGDPVAQKPEGIESKNETQTEEDLDENTDSTEARPLVSQLHFDDPSVNHQAQTESSRPARTDAVETIPQGSEQPTESSSPPTTEAVEAILQEPDQPPAYRMLRRIFGRMNLTNLSSQANYQSLPNLQFLPHSEGSSEIDPQTEYSRPPSYHSSYDAGGQMPSMSSALRSVPSEISLPPSYHSRMSLAAPVGPNDVIIACNQMTYVSHNIVAIIPAIDVIIVDILDVYPESRKWNKTKARIAVLTEKVGKFSTKVEKLHTKTKGITMQDWSENNTKILKSVKRMIKILDSLSSKMNKVMEDLSDQDCVLAAPQRARVSNTMKVLTEDLGRLKQRIQMVTFTPESRPLCTCQVSGRDLRRWWRSWKMEYWGNNCIVIVIFGLLIAFGWAIYNFIRRHSK